MSLVCHQCGGDMKPLNWLNIHTIEEAISKLPEQEALFVSPVITGFGWRPTALGDDEEFPSFFRVPVDSSISLCFGCIEKAGANHKGLLLPVYRAFAAECIYQRDKDSPTQPTDLFDRFQDLKKEIPTSCLLCNSPLEAEIQAPSFVCRVLDAISSINRFRENTSNDPILKTADSIFGWASNYQWTTCEPGMTTFRVCHKCLQKLSPRIHDDFACNFAGVKSPHYRESEPELSITQAVLDQLEKELGPDGARKALESMPGKVSIITPREISEN